MLAIVFFFLIISSGSVFSSAVFQKKYEEVLPITNVAIVVLLFLFGILGNLETGVVICCGLSIILYAVALVWTIKKREYKLWIKNIFTPGFFCYFIWNAVLIFLIKGKLMHSWDEFSHWGDIVKVMVTYDDFGTNPLSDSMFASYPPGLSLFQYMLQKINVWISGTVFTEWLLYVAYHMCAFSFPAYFLKGTGKRIILHTLVIMGALFVIPTLFYPEYYTTLYVDPFLGILSGSGLACVLLRKEKDRFYSLYIIAICSMLVMTKDAGMLFAILIGCAYLVDILFCEKTSVRRFFLQSVIVIGAIALPKLIWDLELHLSKTSLVFHNGIEIGKLLDIFSGADNTYLSQVWKNYWNAIITKPLSMEIIGINVSSLVIILAAIIVLTFLLNIGVKKELVSKRKCLLMMTVILMQVIAYVAGLVGMYLFQFTEYAATRLASFERYINILHLSVWIVIFLFASELLYNIVNQGKRYVIYMVVIIYLLIIIPLDVIAGFSAYEWCWRAEHVRSEFSETVNITMERTEPWDRVYIIAQESMGYEPLVLKYLLRPHKVNRTGYRLGLPLYEGDSGYTDISPDEWMEEICTNYDYVIIFGIDDYFIETYGKLFEKQETIKQGLYRINKTTRILEFIE